MLIMDTFSYIVVVVTTGRSDSLFCTSRTLIKWHCVAAVLVLGGGVNVNMLQLRQDQCRKRL